MKIYTFVVIILIVCWVILSAYILDTSFGSELHRTIGVILSEVWGLVKQPIVFVALLGFLALFRYRESLPNFLSGLKKIGAGSVIAEFDFAKDLVSKSPAREDIPQTGEAPESLGNQEVEKPYDGFAITKEIAAFLLSVDRKNVERKEFGRELGRAAIGSYTDRKSNDEERYAIGVGYLMGAAQTIPNNFDFDIDDVEETNDKDVVYLKLSQPLKNALLNILAGEERMQ